MYTTVVETRGARRGDARETTTRERRRGRRARARAIERGARGVMRRAVVALARAIERERGLKAAVATGGADARSLMTTATATGGAAKVATTRARGDAWGLTAQMVARRDAREEAMGLGFSSARARARGRGGVRLGFRDARRAMV